MDTGYSSCGRFSLQNLEAMWLQFDSRATKSTGSPLYRCIFTSHHRTRLTEPITQKPHTTTSQKPNTTTSQKLIYHIIAQIKRENQIPWYPDCLYDIQTVWHHFWCFSQGRTLWKTTEMVPPLCTYVRITTARPDTKLKNPFDLRFPS